jgi:hypothetical protein
MTTSHSWLPPSTENFNSEVEVHIATGKMVCPFGVSQVIDWQTNLGPREVLDFFSEHLPLHFGEECRVRSVPSTIKVTV